MFLASTAEGTQHTKEVVGHTAEGGASVSAGHEAVADTVHGAVEAAGHAVEGAHGAAHGAGEGMSNEVIMHHLLDSNELELFFMKFHLPEFHLFGIDFSITKHVFFMWVAAALLILGFGLAFRKRKMVNTGFANFLEMLVIFVRDDIVRNSMGKKEGDKVMPWMLTVFFFVLLMNLLGMIPWGSTATGNVSVTAGLALLSFFLIQAKGMMAQGPIKYYTGLVPKGIPAFVIPIMIPVEIIGLFTKPFALCIRLFANMIAGHAVILSLLGLIFIAKVFLIPLPIFGAVVICMLEIFVAFIQAFIFTL
ncbi:MAG: F0F1 ATP synthase subunit A, partial [FCB group bacterium]|nr:F0F1 ATP synthase subunit A [FCB group bacterium]